MSDLYNQAINAINLGLCVIILILVLDAGRVFLRVQPEVILARAFFADKAFIRTSWILLLALMIFTVSNAIELYQSLIHLDWSPYEIIESLSLAVIVISLAKFRGMLHPALEAADIPTIKGNEK